MSLPIKAEEKNVVDEIMKENDTFLFDCDGVLWGGGRIYSGVSETLNKLHAQGKKVVFVTNNSTKTRDQYLEKVRSYGIEAAEKEVYCTAYTSALYLKDKLHPGDLVYVVGNQSIGSELDKFGIKHFGIGPDTSVRSAAQAVNYKEPMRKNVKAVIVGFDDYFSYAKLMKAISYLSKPGTLFLATNMDANFPMGGFEYQMPGTGALIAAVIYASERQPDVICGKPNCVMIDCIKAQNDFDQSRAIMVGDRLDTDILFGNKNGLKTLLVMTGVTSQKKLEEISKSQDPEIMKLKPVYYAKSLGDFGKLI